MSKTIIPYKKKNEHGNEEILRYPVFTIHRHDVNFSSHMQHMQGILTRIQSPYQLSGHVPVVVGNLVYYPEWLLRTTDMYGLSQHFPGGEIQEVSLDPTTLDLSVDESILPKEWFALAKPFVSGRDARLFPTPFFDVPLPSFVLDDDKVSENVLYQVQTHLSALSVQPVVDLHTGYVCAYRYRNTVDGDDKQLCPFDLATDEQRDQLFPNWEHLIQGESILTKIRKCGGSDSSYSETEGKYIPEGTLKQCFFTHSLVGLRARCGTGKSFEFVRFLYEEWLANPKLRVLFFSTTIAFANSLEQKCKQYKDWNVVNYRSKEGLLLDPRLILSLESIERLGPNTYFDYVIADEWNDLLHKFFSPTMPNPAPCFTMFKECIQQANRVLIASADLDATTIRLFRQFRPRDPFILHNHEAKEFMGRVGFVSSFWDFKRLIVESVKRGHRSAIPCSAQEMADDLGEQLRALGLNVLVVHSKESSIDAAMAIYDEVFLAAFDVIIYTATYGPGVSMDAPKQFSRVFQYLLADHDLYSQKQALFRVRDVTDRLYIIHMAEPKPYSLPTKMQDLRQIWGYRKETETLVELGMEEDALEVLVADFQTLQMKTAEPDPLLLEIFLEFIRARNIGRMNPLARYMYHIQQECQCERILIQPMFMEMVGGRVCVAAGMVENVAILERTLGRRELRVKAMSEVEMVVNETEDRKKRAKLVGLTAEEKVRECGGAIAIFMEKKDPKTGQPAPFLLGESVIYDVQVEGCRKGIRCFRALIFPTKGRNRSIKFGPTKEEIHSLMKVLATMLGFKEEFPLEDRNIIYHCKQRLTKEESDWLRENTGLIKGALRISEFTVQSLYGKAKGKAFCDWSGDKAVPFSKSHPFPEYCPKLIVLNILSKLLTSAAQVRIEMDNRIEASLPHSDWSVHSPKELTYLKTIDYVSKIQAHTPLLTCQRVYVYHLKIGPEDKKNRFIELLYKKAENGGHVDMKNRLELHVKKQPTKEKSGAQMNVLLADSYYYRQDILRLEKLKKEAKAEDDRYRLLLVK